MKVNTLFLLLPLLESLDVSRAAFSKFGLNLKTHFIVFSSLRGESSPNETHFPGLTSDSLRKSKLACLNQFWRQGFFRLAISTTTCKSVFPDSSWLWMLNSKGYTVSGSITSRKTSFLFAEVVPAMMHVLAVWIDQLKEWQMWVIRVNDTYIARK